MDNPGRNPPGLGRTLPLFLCLALALSSALLGQPDPQQATPPPAPAAPSGMDETDAEKPAAAKRDIDDPYDAYEAGLYDLALERFVDLQVERPDDPELLLNLGSVHYQMKNYEAAEKDLGSAALAGVPELRAQALYNLGNVAYRKGQLEDAIRLYQSALEVDPDDEDAKFNLEFVRDEIRRRHEEAQKRQQEQQQQDQQQEQQQDNQGQEGSQEPQSQPQGSQPEPQAADQDGDALPDAVERSGENPTDPRNPDSDNDGLRDGEEDLNRNGKVDPGETDPNKVDTDGDGVSDAEERDQAPGQGEPSSGEPEEMTPEEAMRYLQALEEDRPRPARPGPRGRRSRSEKDW